MSNALPIYHAPESCHVAVHCYMAAAGLYTDMQRLLWRHLMEVEVSSSQPCRSQTIIWFSHPCLTWGKHGCRMAAEASRNDELAVHGNATLVADPKVSTTGAPTQLNAAAVIILI